MQCNVTEFPSCCAIAVIHDFDSDWQDYESIEEAVEYCKSDDYQEILATTIPGQEEAEAELRKNGFTRLRHKVQSMHGPYKISMWRLVL